MAEDEPKNSLASQLKEGGNSLSSRETWKKWSQLTAQAWVDDKFKQRLIADPAALLQEHGIATPPGVEVRVVENTDKVYYFCLPAKPAGDVTELTSSQLEGAVALFCCWCYPPSICSPITIDPTAPPLECITPRDPCRR
jgi:hypothetical protein